MTLSRPLIRSFFPFLVAAALALPACGGGSPTGPDPSAAQPPATPTPSQPPPPPPLPPPGGIAHIEITPGSVIGSGGVQGTLRLVSTRTDDLVVLLSSNSFAAEVPGSVTVAAGSLSSTFRVATRSVTQDTDVIVTATAGTQTMTAPLRVIALRVTELKMRADVGGAFPFTGTVEVDARVGVDGPPITVALSSSDSAVTVPATVRVLDGHAMATFDAQTRNVSSPRIVTLTARAGGETRSRSVNLWPVFLSFVGQRGDAVTQGQSHRFEASAGRRFSGIYRNGRLFIQTTAPGNALSDNWNISFSAGPGNPLVPGRYVKSDPFSDIRLEFVGQGRFCLSTGEFEVLDAEFEEDGDIVRFRATFRHACITGGPPVTGEVWVASLPAP